MLRWLAMLTMFIDHLGVYFYDLLPTWLYDLMRAVGRIAMPIFAYYLAKGFRRTSNLLFYFLRLAATAVLTHIVVLHCYTLCGLNTQSLKPNFVFNLCLGLLFLAGWELITKSYPEVMVKLQPAEPSPENPKLYPYQARITVFGFKLQPKLGLLMGSILLCLSLYLSSHYQVAYGIYGIFLIWIFYYAEEKQSLMEQERSAFMLFSFMSLLLISLGTLHSRVFSRVSPTQVYALISIPIIYRIGIPYDQAAAELRRAKLASRQLSSKALARKKFVNRLVSYLFYPLHFYLIMFLRLVVFKAGEFFSSY
ncbi:MAG: TraX family protein [Eubacteriales bacterium]|nr:TraX family protein [Eubacteriales bacterium]